MLRAPASATSTANRRWAARSNPSGRQCRDHASEFLRLWEAHRSQARATSPKLAVRTLLRHRLLLTKSRHDFSNARAAEARPSRRHHASKDPPVHRIRDSRQDPAPHLSASRPLAAAVQSSSPRQSPRRHFSSVRPSSTPECRSSKLRHKPSTSPDRERRSDAQAFPVRSTGDATSRPVAKHRRHGLFAFATTFPPAAPAPGLDGIRRDQSTRAELKAPETRVASSVRRVRTP